MREMNWVQRKIYLYNVTFGLYMLDSWERYSFNALVIVLIWFVLRYFAEFFKRYVWWEAESFSQEDSNVDRWI